MRPNRIGWLLVAFFFAVGAALTGIDPEIWLGPMFMGGALVLAIVYVVMNRRADRAERLMSGGIRGDAELLQITQTGMYLNENPRVRLRLRIQAPGVPPFEVTRTFTVPLVALGALTAGQKLPVYVDRADTSRFTIDWFGGHDDGGASASPRERLERLSELQDTELISDEEFEQQRARILDSL